MIKLKLLKQGNSKLACIKALKEGTQLGLKDCKWILDNAVVGQSQDVDALDADLLRVSLMLMSPDYEWLVTDTVADRKRKFVDLGLGDDSDKIDILCNSISVKILRAVRGVVNTDERKLEVIKSTVLEVFGDLDDAVLIDKLYKSLAKKLIDE